MGTIETTTKSTYIKIAITVLIPILLVLIPESESYTRNIKWFVALTAGMLIWAAFELTDLLVPSILWPGLLIALGVLPMNIVYNSWLSLVIPCCVAAIALGKILDDTGLFKRITYWLVWRCGGSFNKTIFVLYLALLVTSIITFSQITVVGAALCAGIVHALGAEKKEEGAIIMMVGLLGAVSPRLFIYKPLTFGLVKGSLENVGMDFSVTAIQFFVHNCPNIIFCLIFIFVMTIVGKTKHSSISGAKEYFESSYKALGKMTKEEKKGIFVLLFLGVGVLTESYHNINGMLIFIFAFALCYLPGISIGNSNAIKAVNLGTIFFIASCMAIGSGCTETGITAILTKTCMPFFTNLGIKGSVIAVLLMGFIMNFAMTPMAMVSAFTGPLVAMLAPLGIESHVVAYTFLASGDLLLFPYEFVNYLIYFSFGCMTMNQFIKYNTIRVFIYIIFFVAVFLPYWSLLGLL